jgi:predicted SprT family Zn-dependent metalloprotease
MKNLYALFETCKNELRAINVNFCENTSIEVNNRAKKRWGMCTKNAPGNYSIQISYRLMGDEVEDKSTKTTIIHELLHTIPGGNGHTGEWKRQADRVNRAYGYNISRTTSAAEKGIEELPINRNYKYKIRCSKCGYTWLRTRATAVTAHPEHYHCHCGGELHVFTT